MTNAANSIDLFALLATDETEAERAVRIAEEKADLEYLAWTHRMFAAGAARQIAYNARVKTSRLLMANAESSNPHGERNRRYCRFD